MQRFLVFTILVCLLVSTSNADDIAGTLMPDTLSITQKTGDADQDVYSFRPKQLIVPGAMIGAGVVGLGCGWLRKQNREIRDELQEHSVSHLSVDDFTQYAPLVAMYGLKLVGVRSRHNFADMTIIAGTAYMLVGASVFGLKSITKIERPDGSARNSFPSGHTATAFAGAELLRLEYVGTSPWIGVAGYVVAAGTGFMRMYNNRHWLTDVVAGAGLGILSARAAYMLYPLVSKIFYPNRNRGQGILVAPYLTGADKGISCSITF